MFQSRPSTVDFEFKFYPHGCQEKFVRLVRTFSQIDAVPVFWYEKFVVTLTAYADIDVWPEYGAEYEVFKEKKVDELVALAAELIPELADPDCVEIKEGFSPRTLERFTMNKRGVVYGFYLSPEQWEKVPNHTPIPNVFIASNWSQAWHGMTSAQINGWRAAQLIIDREGQ